MADTAISVEGLGKQYRLSARKESYRTLRDSVAQGLSTAGKRILSLARREAPPPAEVLWALRDISFEISRGDIVGIVGRNGAGKTTLLKILSRITEPTLGEARIHGRVGALLEVGTGFHRELSGRENVYLNGAILGMKKAEIARKFDAIVSFAELDRFIDTAVKHYSSGMYMRLAFSVAAHLDPEVLLVDEVLAVGDAAFQRKCLAKIGEVGAGGQTVLFVSHDLRAVSRICPRAILLEDGQIRAFSDTAEIVSEYLGAGDAIAAELRFSPQEAPGDDDVRLRWLRAHDSEGTSRAEFERRSPIVVEIAYTVTKPLSKLTPQIILFDRQGTLLFLSVHEDGPFYEHHDPGDYVAACEIPGHLLNDGTYTLQIDLIRIGRPIKTHVHIEDALTFQVAESIEEAEPTRGIRRKIPGILRPHFDWRHERARARDD